MATTKAQGAGIKTFQKLAKDKGHYGSVMYQRLGEDTTVAEKFQAARQQRISRTNEMGEGDFGDQTFNIVATAALYTDPDISRFVNALAIKATLAASEQLKVDDGKERFAGAFEIHVLKADIPTMHCFIFYRKQAEPGIRRLHKDLKEGNVPGMESFKSLGVTLGQTGLTKPYSRYGPGGEPYLHGNSGDGEGGFDPSKDWKSYKIPLQFPDKPQFSDYKSGNPALVTHLDDVAALPFHDLAILLCEMELPELEMQSKAKFIQALKSNISSLDSLAAKFRTSDDEEKAKTVEHVATLLNMNTVYDVQNTKTAEFWRTFK